ncbi:hypothetical protein DPV78_007544 [Talaromyces pinophilus]|nr:hypothetical protein DPV78_007544 [Talaromyces pinophilus]
MPPSALLATSITRKMASDSIRTLSKQLKGQPAGLRPRESPVQEASAKEGPERLLDGVITVRSRGSRAEFAVRPRGSSNLRGSMVVVR